MKKYVLSMVLGLAALFPFLAGAVSVDQTLVISNTFGKGGRFYNAAVPDFMVAISGWSERYELPTSSLIPGEYVLIDTNDPDLCSNLTLDECRSSPDFVGEISVLIKPDLIVLNSPKETATTTSTTATGIIPSVINGVLDFFGISAGTMTANSTGAPVTETVSSAAETVATTSVSSAATTTSSTDATIIPATGTVTTPPTDATAASSTETTPLPQGELISPPVATTTQASLKNSFLAAVGLLSLRTGNVLVSIVVAIGILLLAFVFYWTNKTSKNKKTKK